MAVLVMLTTTCPTCGGTPCINFDFCRLCRAADQHKTRNRLAWNPQPEPPEPPTERLVKQPLCGDWAAEAWNSPTWKQAAQKYHQARAGHVLIVETAPEKLAQLRRLMGDDVSLNAAWAEFSDPRDRPIPKATIDAIMFDLRERGIRHLKSRPLSGG
jgi:hypothetical protein